MKNFLLIPLLALSAYAQQTPFGLFDSHADIGINPKSGSAVLTGTEYKISGNGANIWANVDALHFAQKRITGDFVLTADIAFQGVGTNNHRKAVLMARQALAPDSTHVSVAVHGDGLTSLQYRPVANAPTLETKAAITAPVRVRLERKGNVFTAYAAQTADAPLAKIAETTFDFTGPVFVGLGVCSHDVEFVETAVFTNVQLTASPITPRPRYRSFISIFDMKTRQTREVFRADEIWEAPNWSHDGKYLLVNSGGRIYKLAIEPGSKPEPLALDVALRCNNDHDFSPDGKLIAVSASTATSGGSQVYIANADGTGAKRIVDPAPSYFHGWAPDGKWLSFVAQRDKNFDLFRIRPDGTGEERLTQSPGYDDGPDYSRDGKWIYFNSDRSGGWDIWRMPFDGAGPNDAKAERITNDDGEDWFPHPSPDGKTLLFLTFPAGTPGHGDKGNVELRIIPMPNSAAGVKPAKPVSIAKFYGGQGTVNVNSWSPDSKQFAYVVFELIQ